MSNKLLTEDEFLDDVIKVYANTESMHIKAGDECFEKMKKYMSKDKIDKAMYLRDIIRLNQDYFLIKY